MKKILSSDKARALAYHRYPHPGKIEIVPTKPFGTPEDLSLAYSPGVAFPCLEISHNTDNVYKYTDRGNIVAVISNGTAVLGLGNIGAEASKPVMEGKALLFRIFAGLNAFDLEISETDPEKFVEIVHSLTPGFGGINLEDIKAPECFEIEKSLREKCDIPVMHDDQHGTAVISGAALVNALLIQNKKIGEVRMVVNGAGAAAIACTRLMIALGVDPAKVTMCDSHGVIYRGRGNLNPQKEEFAVEPDGRTTLAEAMAGADVFLGLSVADIVTPEMLASMAPRPVVFALANPSPEIAREKALAVRKDLIYATGRSDYPNQINNVIGFPYIFRGALDCRASDINENMKIAAAHAIAALARENVPKELCDLYGVPHLEFGPDYILPKPFDRRLLATVPPAIAGAAADSGVARAPIADMKRYARALQRYVQETDEQMRRFVDSTAV